jgi:hypothetical protein
VPQTADGLAREVASSPVLPAPAAPAAPSQRHARQFAAQRSFRREIGPALGALGEVRVEQRRLGFVECAIDPPGQEHLRPFVRVVQMKK